MPLIRYAYASQLVNCGLSDATVANLEKKGITALFPIQKHVFEPAMEGRDLIGRARTGSGKTLAFALPVIESLVKARPCFSWLAPTPVITGRHVLPICLSESWGNAAFSLSLAVPSLMRFWLHRCSLFALLCLSCYSAVCH